MPLERRDAFFAVNMLDAAAILIEPLDPELAYLLKLVYRRAPGSIIPAVAANSIPASRQAEIEADAAAIQLDDAVHRAVVALNTPDQNTPAP